MEILIAIIFALFVFCIVYWITYRISSKRINIRNRINKISAKEFEDNEALKDEMKKGRERKVSFGKRLSSDLEAAGILLRSDEYLLIWAGTTIVPSLLFFLAGGNVISVIAILIIGFIIPPLLVSRSKRQRIQKFDKQLAESIVVISNSIRAGFTFQQAMESISKEMPNPLAVEFARTLWEVKLGSSIEHAMERMALRMKSKDLDLVVSSVLIQRKTGGNLSEVLNNIAITIRDRQRIKGEVRVLTASGRVSGIIIGLLPIFILGILMIINPTYIQEFLSTTVGIVMMICALFLEVIGFLVIRKIVDIKL